MTTFDATAHRPGSAEPSPPGSAAGDLPADGGTVELFPVNFTTYQHASLPDLDTEQHVRAIADLLAPYGLQVNQWAVPGEGRNGHEVEDRLRTWKHPAAAGNTVLYWVGHGTAKFLAHHHTPAPIDDGVGPQNIAHAIAGRQIHPDSADSWAVIVLDACFSRDFARAVHLELFTHYPNAGRYLLLSTAAEGPAELGAFTSALDRALRVTFPTQRTIGLATLGRHLAEDLGGFVDDLTLDDRRDQLVSLTPSAATAVSGPLDQIAELQAVIEQLPADEQRHFLPKASGAELGEFAWYFRGRTVQRDRILHWLTITSSGTLVVTGPAGAGKSALLGHVLLHTSTRLRDILIRHGHLTPLPPGTPCPDDPFDLTAHLAGLTLSRTLQLVAQAADLPDFAREATDGNSSADLAARLLERLRDRHEPLTLLFDALDEAEQPLLIADTLLRPLAALPGVRLVVGTRRSTKEGPDQPAPDDTDLLDALRPRSAKSDGGQAADPQYVEVTQDPEALAGYLRAKLHAAKHLGTLDTDDTTIATAVHRLVTDHQQDGVEPQQFLYARLAAHELLSNPDLLADPTPLIGRSHRQLFALALERLHRINPFYTPLLRALGLAQGRGLPDQDGIWTRAAEVLAPGGAGDIGSVIPDLVHDAAPYLALDQEHGQSVYRLAHRTFTEHFTVAPDAPAAHAAITTALIGHAGSTLRNHGRGDSTTPRHEDISAYIRRYLINHARLGHAAGALRALADHPDILDALDLTGITTTALQHGLPPSEVPPAIAGTVLLQHHAQEINFGQHDHDTFARRRWWRRLGTTYIQGTSPPAEPHTYTPTAWPLTLVAGAVRRRQLHLQLIARIGRVWAMAVFAAPDGTPRLATGGDDGTVRIWNPVVGTQDGQALTGHDSRVTAVAVFAAPDGTPRLATSGYDGTVRIWNPATGTQDGPALVGSGTGLVRAVVAFTAPDGTPRLATGEDYRPVRIWNPATGTQDTTPFTGHTGGVRAVAVFAAPDGTPRLATGGYDGTVRIWNPATGTQDGPALRDRKTGGVHAVAVFAAPDGTPRLATSGSGRKIRIWNPATGTQDGPALTGHDSMVHAVAVFAASDGTPRLATGSDDATVRIWNPAARTQDGLIVTGQTGQTGGVHSVAVFAAPDGTPRLATGGDDTTVRIWNPATDTQDSKPTGDAGGVHAVAVFAAPDGTPRLATGGHDGTVRIWNPATDTQDGQALTGHDSRVTAVAVFAAPDGTPRLATSGYDGTVRIWNPATGTQDSEPLTGDTGGATAVAVFAAPDGTPRLAIGGHDGTVRIWNPATGTRDGPALIGHTGGATAVVAFTAPDGTARLATGSEVGPVRIWNPATGTQDSEPVTGHAGDTGRADVMAVFTAPDGTPRLATGDKFGTVRVWNPAMGTRDGPALTDHTGRVNAVAAFTAPDGTPRLATGGDDRTVRILNPCNRNAHTLFVADQVYALTEHRGLLIAGTDSGYLGIDISSVPTHTA